MGVEEKGEIHVQSRGGNVWCVNSSSLCKDPHAHDVDNTEESNRVHKTGNSGVHELTAR